MGGRTKTTRIGNGAGYGGDARTEPRGERAPLFQPGQSGNPAGVPGDRAALRLARAEAVEDFWAAVMANEDQFMPNRIKVSENLHRAGKPELYRTLPDRETAEVEWYIEGVAEAVSVDDWVQQVQLARAKPQGSAD